VWWKGEVKAFLRYGNPEGNRQLGKPRLKWENNIKDDIQELTWWH